MKWPVNTIVLLFVAAGCTNDRGSHGPGQTVLSSPTASGSARVRKEVTIVPVPDDAPDGLHFEVRAGTEPKPERTRTKTAKTSPLAGPAVEALLGRLDPLPAAPADTTDFALRPRARPAPRPGETTETPFPPPASDATPPPSPPTEPVRMLRMAPDGPVKLAPHVSITFSQAMVPVTGQGTLAEGDVPVTLTPEPAGRWRWLGTKTLLFEAEGHRLPMATRYEVRTKAGYRSAAGGAIQESERRVFATPPPSLERSFPAGQESPLEPVIALRFDQRVEPTAVLANLRVRANGRSVPVRPAQRAEIERDPAARSFLSLEPADRNIFVRPVTPLPRDTTIDVEVEAGLPSGEGPRTTERALNFSFRTHPPLRVTETRCSWSQDCPPLAPWSINFNNPLDLDAFDPAWVTVEPEVEDLDVRVVGNMLQLHGQTRGHTTYRIELSAKIRDEFGQTLGAPETQTMKVGTARPTLFASGGQLAVLDPMGARELVVHSINYPHLHVRLFRVQPKDWTAFLESFHTRRGRTTTPPGANVFDQEVKVDAEPDTIAKTRIDLTAALDDGLGHVVVEVRPADRYLADQARQYAPRVYKWVQSTQLGLTAFKDPDQMVVWVTRLSDGKPVESARVFIGPGGPAVAQTAGGLAVMELPPRLDGAKAMLVAELEGDRVFLPEQRWARGRSSWTQTQKQNHLRWFVFDDRGLYRPNETVRVKGWIRGFGAEPRGDVFPLRERIQTVEYQVTGPRGNKVGEGQADVSGHGSFDLEFALPDDVNLGLAHIELRPKGALDRIQAGHHVHTFQIEEFRRPEFEVETNASDGPHFIGEQLTASVTARYFAGGFLAGADLTWTVRTEDASYRPPGHDEYAFGRWRPWWSPFPTRNHGTPPKTFSGRTDAAGTHHLQVDLQGVKPPRATMLIADAWVTDVNRQTWRDSATVLVHPGELYVGLRSTKNFVREGETLVVDHVVTDIDGARQPGRSVEVVAHRVDHRWKSGKYEAIEDEVGRCQQTSGKAPVTCRVDVKHGGQHRIRARVVDDRDRPNETEITVWVAGGGTPPDRQLAKENVELIPNGERFAPGDTAELLVVAPFADAEGVLTLRRSGLIESRRFTMKGWTHTLSIPIEAAYLPNLWVEVDLAGKAPRVDGRGQPDPKQPPRPAYASGRLNLTVSTMTRALRVDATPEAVAVLPGAETHIDIRVTTSAGAPVPNAEVALVVVDEAVLALSGYVLDDPLEVFYAARAANVVDYHTRADVILDARPDAVEEGTGTVTRDRTHERKALRPSKAAMGSLADFDDGIGAASANMMGGPAAPPIRVRRNFSALAHFAPRVRTDRQGAARVPVQLPDDLTRYRIVAVAADATNRFGKGESTLTARQPLMIRPAPPRFLNFGDRFELPVVLQNQTDSPLDVEVAVRGANIELTGPRGLKVTLPAQDRVEVRFPAAAARAGTARFQVAAAAGPITDAAQGAFPVWTPATTEAFATYGTIQDGNIVQPVTPPKDVVPEFGALEITTASTQLQALTDAFIYLLEYPYGCAEPVSSRILSVAALKDVLTSFEAAGLPDAAQLTDAMSRDIDKLAGLQNRDGGWGFWHRHQRSWPFVSVHAMHALLRAKDKAFEVPEATISRGIDYLRNIRERFPSGYPAPTRRAIESYALYVRALMGDLDGRAALRILQEEGGVKTASLELLGWLYPVLIDGQGTGPALRELRRHLTNRATETAGTAHFATHYKDGAHLLLHSDRRVDGILLEGLLRDTPKSDLVPKVVRGLLAHRQKGRWSNTQENVWVLLALDRYFKAYERTTPSFVARVWLGDVYAGEHAFRGRTTEQHHVAIPATELAQRNKTDVLMQKDGKGRLYYRIGLRYAPKSLTLDPAEHGFAVERRYEAVDDPKDVTRQPDGTWRIKAGSRVRVRLGMVAPTRRYHVALVDPLPAGLEPLNPSLPTTENIPEAPDTSPPSEAWWWFQPWYEHQNLRDERVEAFASTVWAGVYTYSYVARATTPGRFIVPPTRAEEMYFPETFGRAGSDTVEVVD